MIPMELVSMGASTILGGVLGIMAQKAKDKADEQKNLMARAGFVAEQADKARDVTDSFTKSTRRYIALIYVGYTEAVMEGFWIFSYSVDVTEWKPMTGLVITPLDTHVVSSIIGLYFGGSLVRR